MWKKEIRQLQNIAKRTKYVSDIMQEIAKELKVHHSTVYRWANGKQLPRKKRKIMLREVLKKYRDWT